MLVPDPGGGSGTVSKYSNSRKDIEHSIRKIQVNISCFLRQDIGITLQLKKEKIRVKLIIFTIFK
jgi:hypothetical protein